MKKILALVLALVLVFSFTACSEKTETSSSDLQYIKDKGIGRSVDSDNIVEFLNWQGDTEALTIEELKQLWNAFYQMKTAALSAEISQIEETHKRLGIGKNSDAAAQEALEKSKAQLESLKKIN